MNRFLELVDNTDRVLVMGTVPRLISADDSILDALSECQPFVFTGMGHKGREVDVTDNIIEDAPFPIFSIERTDGDIGTIRCSFGKQTTPVELNVCCAVCIEIEPRVFNSLVLVDDINLGLCIVPLQNNAIAPLINRYLERLSADQVGLETTRKNVKIGKGSHARLRRIRRIIRIAHKTDIKKDPQSFRKVNWSHRFEVRGHWRKIESVGKDREGRYCVSGFTWVSHHTRGPENLPMVKKVRLVDSSIRPLDGQKDYGA